MSLVDMYVPVTAIDEVLEDYEYNVEDEGKPLTKTVPDDCKGKVSHCR